MATNAKSVFFLSQEVGKIIQEGGAIVNISSGITQTVIPEQGVYAATKGAVSQFTKAFAFELASKNVTVVTVSPGATETGMNMILS
jgi:NAD(P)-dependent dehydrogenase (short-subunit alcohol dehydrogenase family)